MFGSTFKHIILNRFKMSAFRVIDTVVIENTKGKLVRSVTVTCQTSRGVHNVHVKKAAGENETVHAHVHYLTKITECDCECETSTLTSNRYGNSRIG